MPASKAAPKPRADLTARAFTERLLALQDDEELRKIQRYFKSGEGEYGHGDTFIGVRMGSIFALAREFAELPPKELEKMLDSDIHEVRVGALSVMAKQYPLKTTTDARRKELYDLYLRRHDRINNWDLVDLAAWHVVGPWLVDKPRAVLHKLAKSKNMWERRTAVLATFSFIRRGEFDDTLRIVTVVLKDKEDLIHKAAGWALRVVGDKDRAVLEAFLDAHAAQMPRAMLSNAIEKFAPADKARYRAM
ncbi:MAG: DNA alkylation repair protein [Devosia sp.]|uniref:DNA alkylation repair protein n=1 Tax=Devosia sp. TaxID=1871048 RepID=UPI001A46ADAF|nr:DNA alkylation repair protein [Devosia sp.]MBL8597729.1 DNA alkylation repair protein [Devosia sp.]